MADIPSVLVTDILLRLPVKTLLRFRSVSKPWLALIDSPYFIRFHLNYSISTNSHRHLIFRDFCLHNSICSLNLDSLNNVIQLQHPIKHYAFETQIVGSSNGLLCLYNPAKGIGLWNPSTQNYHNLPPADLPETDQLGSWSVIFGFGYDHLNDDYKVLRIIQSYNSQAKVYSLKSNSWKMVSDFPYYLSYCRANGVFAHGALHWVVQSKLITFDLGTGEYRVVPQPDFLDTEFRVNVGALGGCLCVISNLDVWVMKEYGVKESWTKLISVAQPNDSRSLSSPIDYSKSGEQVLLEKDNGLLVSYDFKREKLETVTVAGLRPFFNSNVCVESLVKLPYGGEGGKNLPSE